MSEYTVYDVSASCERVGLARDDIASVPLGWGVSGWGPEWTGGFLFSLKDGTFAYVTGWCDSSGWGCQDGAEVHRFDSMPTREALEAIEDRESVDWDEEPADANRWARGEIEDYA